MSNIRKISDLLHCESERGIVTLTCLKHGEYTGESVVTLDFLGREQKIPPPCPSANRNLPQKSPARKRGPANTRLSTGYEEGTASALLA
jgi:hypothetical protein